MLFFIGLVSSPKYCFVMPSCRERGGQYVWKCCTYLPPGPLPCLVFTTVWVERGRVDHHWWCVAAERDLYLNCFSHFREFKKSCDSLLTDTLPPSQMWKWSLECRHMYADVSFPLDNVQRLLRGVKKSHIGVLSDNRPEMQKALRIAQMQIWPPKNSTNNTYCNLQKNIISKYYLDDPNQKP